MRSFMIGLSATRRRNNCLYLNMSETQELFKLTDKEMKGYQTWDEAFQLFKKTNKDFLKNKGDQDALVLFLMKNKRL